MWYSMLTTAHFHQHSMSETNAYVCAAHYGFTWKYGSVRSMYKNENLSMTLRRLNFWRVHFIYKSSNSVSIIINSTLLGDIHLNGSFKDKLMSPIQPYLHKTYQLYYNLENYSKYECPGKRLDDGTVFSNIVPYTTDQIIRQKHTWRDILFMWSDERHTARWE